mgnify:CR=1 FL=1
MKNLYIVISRTHTTIGWFIRKMTGYQYNHVSVSFNQNLVPLYSYARYHRNHPFYGGFVEESWLRYIQKGKNVQIIVFEIPITEEKYEELYKGIQGMKRDKRRYRYSYVEALNSKFLHQKLKLKDKHTCLSFSIYLLKKAGILKKSEKIFSIEELCCQLKKFPYQKIQIRPRDKYKYSWGEDDYLKEDTY